ncbi:MAG TPA: R3H domain-containing nucleic acid-binding protein [Candidatus Paceibacterota bacterium]|nr:R3H domain-containing nucleic acid-binding protein [Candidatus Paceibacterota bacterium]
MNTIIRTMIEKMGATVTEVREEHDVTGGVIYHVDTPNSAVLIGPDGETLKAINFLAKRIAEYKELPTTFHVDIGGYEEARRKKIATVAKIYAERARYFKASVPMEPMNPYDRLIVHATLQEISDVTTSSEGVGLNRHVVVFYKAPETETGFN